MTTPDLLAGLAILVGIVGIVVPVLPGTVLVGGTPEAPFPSDQFDKVTMARFFSPHARTLADTFVGCRIELYPGEIDKLW